MTIGFGCNYISQFTLDTYCYADSWCLFKQSRSVIYYWNQYNEEISEKYMSVSLPFYNAAKIAKSPSLFTEE